MVDLIEEALQLQAFLESHACRFCFIGGVAVQWWGEPRLTRDIDVSLLAGFGGEDHYVDLLLGAYAPRIEDARQFALAHRVLLLRGAGGIGIDVSLAALPYEEAMIARAPAAELMPGRKLRLCSPEDLLIMSSSPAVRRIFAMRVRCSSARDKTGSIGFGSRLKSQNSRASRIIPVFWINCSGCAVRRANSFARSYPKVRNW